MKIAILGSGTWGSALAKTLCVSGHETSLWSKFPQEIDELKANLTHKNLKGMVFPNNILFTSSLKEAVKGCELVIIATPSLYVRSTVESLLPYLENQMIIACVAKGLEEKTLYTMTEVIDEVVAGANPVVALSGPTHAEEVALEIPTTIVCAGKDQEATKKVQQAFVGTCIRPYTNDDVLGVELCGALKNIIALACGISSGLGYGDNTKAALITRGLSEITRLGLALNCNKDTFAGLAGIGDLIVTATSEHSRNNRCGQFIGKGYDIDSAVKEVGMVVEGLNALPGALALAEKHNVDMPITKAIGAIVDGKLSAKEAVNLLLNRDIKSEKIGD